MIARYTKPEMGAFFTDEAQWDAVLQVHLAAVGAMRNIGSIPQEDFEWITGHAPEVTPELVVKIQEREAVTDHDVAAYVDVIQEEIGSPAARWIHYGLTSSDVTDTALCLRLRDASGLLLEECGTLIKTVCNRAREFADVKTAGRTHGQHAEIITFGVRLTNWALMLDRAYFQLKGARSGIAVGKLSGACGTYSNIDPEIEKQVCGQLGLTPITATQVIPRDLHATLLQAVTGLGNVIDHMFLNERVMAMTEVGEVEEGRRTGQKGSSAMPHKRNPIKGEQLCGLARMLRGYSHAAEQNVALLFERDISHSAPERIALADSLILAHYMVVTANRVMEKLVVHPDRMWDNIERTHGLMFTQTLLTKLIDKGMERDPAYRLVQDLSNKVLEGKGELRELVEAENEVPYPASTTTITSEEIEEVFDPEPMVRNVGLVLDQLPI